MNIWEILKIPETKDKNAIRKAYAKQAECFHPEEHPEEFLLIRDAYKQALAFAGKQSEADIKVPEAGETKTGLADSIESFDTNISQTAEKPRERFQFEDDNSDSLQEKYLMHPGIESFKRLYLSKHRRDRKQWESYFMSAGFLSDVREEGFTGAMSRIVEEHLEDYPPAKEFQTMLAVAYRYRAVEYQNHVEFKLEQGCGFDGIESIYRIASKGPLVRKLQGNDLALESGFRDYWYLNSFAQAGKWDDAALSELGRVLNCYSMAYLKEKCGSNVSTYCERNPASIRLLEYFFEQEGLPEAAYQMLWYKFDLKNAVMGRAKIFYGRLREIVMEKAPQVCGEKEERFTGLHKAFLDYARACYLRHGEDPDADIRDTDALFDREDFKRALKNRKFAEENILSTWISENRCFYYLKRLAAWYEARPELPFADKVTERISFFLKSKQNAIDLENDAKTEISLESLTVYQRPFLRYFISNAFFYAKSEETYEPLFDYLAGCFPASAEWNKKLAGLCHAGKPERELLRKSYILEQEEDGNSLKGTIDLVFRQFYVEYFFNGEPVYHPFLPFEWISGIEDADRFFMLLPVSAAYGNSFFEVKQEVEKRLGKLPFPDEHIAFTADCIASYICCLIIAHDQEGQPYGFVNRPMAIWRETEDRAYACEWYGNGQLFVIERTDKQYRYLPDSRYENITPEKAAVTLSMELLDQLTAPDSFSELILRKYPEILYADPAGKPSYVLEGEEVTGESVSSVIHRFLEGRLNRLELYWELDSRSLVFIRDGQRYACLFFNNRKKYWYSLLSLPEMYFNMDSKDIVRIPFLLGSLPAYSVHQNTRLLAKLLPSILADLSLDAAGLEQRMGQSGLWASNVYLNSAEIRYLFAKRTLGGFPPQRARNVMGAKFVLSMQPQTLWYINMDGTETREEITAVNNREVQELLAGFVMNRLNRLVLIWKAGQPEETENKGLKLMLLHQKLGEHHQYAAIVLNDHKRTIEYLVGDVTAYINAEKKIPMAEFMGERIPFYLVHSDLVRIRDFLDLFLPSLPDIEAITGQLGEFAFGAQLKNGMDYDRFTEEAFPDSPIPSLSQ